MTAQEPAQGDAGSGRRAPRRPEPDNLRAYGSAAPLLIIVYIALLMVLRLNLSDFLEVDESQFVGAVDYRLLYGNSHPPLFNWMMRVTLTLTGWDWPLSVTLVKLGLLAAFHWFVWDCAERLSGSRAALLAVAVSAFLPQIMWMSVFTLAHSVLAMTGIAALVSATLRAMERPGIGAYLWLGFAAALGPLGKFHAFLFVIPFVAMMLVDPALRRALIVDRRAWAAPVAFLVALGPVLVALVADLAGNTSRVAKLYGGGGAFSAVDLPGIGVDGFLGLCAALLAWAGPAALVWFAARRLDRPAPVFEDDATEIGRAFMRGLGRSLAIAVALMALIVLAADMHKVHERYLTPLLAALPIYFGVRWPLARSAGVVAALAGLAFLAVPVGIWAAATYGKHRFGYPYPDVASQIAQQVSGPLPIRASRHDDAANVVLALGWPGAREPSFQPVEDQMLLLWQGRSDAPKGLAPAGFGPAGPIITVVAPFVNQRSGEMVYRFQLFERIGPNAEQLPDPGDAPAEPAGIDGAR